ncbi:OmpA family protein [Geotalea sp. SG265]|uniref:OmpA family protein n=1 Tax=Geotalea sp. SG265 TaxID=2922867 RepID=UPI001FAFA37F|nr:OmpA family protein [Geotalea sp. SG265]
MRISLLLFIVFVFSAQALANPTQTGVTGLVTVPTADTLDAGNICVGVWGNFGKAEGKDFVIMPATITLGVGSFWEIYGTYPNLLFNDRETRSGRGTVDAGSKIRFFGKRSSTFKLAGDVFVQKHISEDLSKDGMTDVGGRLIASLKLDPVSVHINGGYLSSDIDGKEYIYGGGLEYLLTPKTKLTLEVSGKGTAPVEALAGLQYYLSPHLTLNLAGGGGITSGSPDWRAIVGLSTCQGIGNYIKPIPTIASEEEEKNKKAQLVKPVKIMPISSLIRTALPAVPVSKLEIPVDPDKEEIVIKPFGQIVIPAQPVAPPVVLPLMPREPKVQPVQPKVQPKVQPVQPKVQEPKITKLETEITIEPKKEIPTDLNPVEESTVEGVSPLYGMEMRGDSLEISAAKAAPISAKMVVYRKFRFADIMFEFGQADLSEEVKKSLSEVAEQARTDKNWTYMRIDGHTDSIGSTGYNMDLSVKRAIAIASYLIIKEGIEPSRVFIKGLGKSKLIGDNSTTEGRRLNRRFEILFLVPKGKK